ncbi:uncharacterized protein BX663DRAFT_499240 [Cokeromyces recurvatus]|uniref:uncharacterized protein n=1 Tax=Cokeromyces recurvatus TaxID=90255 RepID=UPI00222031C5|nr:uncharacterized protein BX663DRAFT_499240 [Cokeromyces recurvatus]KAI7906206.1 hypothetical protein BX663DRAFT_499240 [Cokeromyces recurvatus]
MSTNFNNFILPSINNNGNCLENYYRYLVGMSINQPLSLVNTIIQQNDMNQYQKLYVDTLVDITTLTIRMSWPMELSSTKEGQPVVNTHVFVRHLLKRSRATRSTLQLAIFYLFRIRPYIAKRSQLDPIVKCGRRMFLAALICAHKYLYDNTFTNASWAKISKLPVKEINAAERSILEMLDYRLYVSTELYQKFESQLREAMPSATTTTNNKKRSFNHDSDERQEPVIIKKQKQPSSHINITHGIPTPEDDKVDFY